ncbi:MAG: nitroreductase family protein [Acidimicrobiaceae bacterium]|nr:nitroreductase family protein [Acidimicrobiaceae bacterium]
MELSEAMRTTGAVREYEPRDVDDATLYAILDDARFAPSGGNRQAWRVIVVRDLEQRRRIRDLYLDAWHDYVAHLLIGVVPFSPLMTDEQRSHAVSQRSAAESASDPQGFAENLDRVPVMLVVCADLGALAASDRDLDRYQIVGGASVYPFVWNILLAARQHDLGGVMTTVATRHEDRLRQEIGAPENFAIASIVVLGHAQRQVRLLARRSVEEFTTIGRLDGPIFLPT